MIHLSSSSLKSTLEKSPVQNYNMLTAFNDQESYNHSISNHQCESFQSLAKKDDIDSTTRNTQWPQNEKDTLLTPHIIDDKNQGRNQNSQKIISYTTIWKFHDDSTQPLEFQEYKKKVIQKIDCMKKNLIESRNQKFKKLRNLLPYFYNVHLPKEMKKMLKIAEEIDKYLIEKKNADYTDNVQNIFKTLFNEEEMSSNWSVIRKLLFICENYYKIRIDPLKNICLGFANKKDNRLANRKEKLRKTVADYFLQQASFEWEKVPEILTDPQKVAKFYPENLNIQQKVKQTKLKPEFLEKLKQRVKKSQLILLQNNDTLTKASPIVYPVENIQSLSQLQYFCDTVSKIYAQKKVSHMYKVSLIENLRKKQIFSLEKIFSLLKYIQEEGIFLEVLMKSGCQIFRINEKEKKSLIEISQIKMNQKKLQ